MQYAVTAVVDGSTESANQVLTYIQRTIEDPLVEWVMLDFEAAAWQAIRDVFPRCLLKGCVFHWSQRVYRKIQSEGLSQAYLDKGDKYDFFRKILALPYLPSEHIPRAFDDLYQQAVGVDGPVLAVVDYVRRVWISNPMWRPENWSVFRQTIRTNNDVEGWHRRINTRAGRSDIGLYVLIPLLKNEADTVDLQIKLVSDHLITRIQRQRYRQIHGRLFDAWDRYEDDDMTTSQLLRTCSFIAGLGPMKSTDRVHDEEL